VEEVCTVTEGTELRRCVGSGKVVRHTDSAVGLTAGFAAGFAAGFVAAFAAAFAAGFTAGFAAGFAPGTSVDVAAGVAKRPHCKSLQRTKSVFSRQSPKERKLADAGDTRAGCAAADRKFVRPLCLCKTRGK
jgi:hypothetical protein